MSPQGWRTGEHLRINILWKFLTKRCFSGCLEWSNVCIRLAQQSGSVRRSPEGHVKERVDPGLIAGTFCQAPVIFGPQTPEWEVVTEQFRWVIVSFRLGDKSWSNIKSGNLPCPKFYLQDGGLFSLRTFMLLVPAPGLRLNPLEHAARQTATNTRLWGTKWAVCPSKCCLCSVPPLCVQGLCSRCMSSSRGSAYGESEAFTAGQLKRFLVVSPLGGDFLQRDLSSGQLTAE